MTEPTPTTSRSDSNASSASSTSTPITALPTEEALQLLLSPDGYYKYLAISKPSVDPMSPKYQAAMAAGGAPTDPNAGVISLDQVKKNYRRLSLKHHPDRKTGDAECFRMLNRAKIVLSSPKLRREYDLVGLDLEDDAEDHDHEDDHNTNDATNNGAATASTTENGEGGGEAHHEDSAKDGNQNKTETVMGHLASATLAAVLQVVVRTALLGLVSVLISRYTILTFLAMIMLAFLTFKMYSTLKQQLGPNVKPTLATLKDVLSPLVIAFGIFCMYRGRRFVVATPEVDVVNNQVVGDGSAATPPDASPTPTPEIEYLDWTWTFLIGETTVLTSFIINSLEQKPAVIVAMVSIPSALLSLWLRGRFWRYATILGFEGILALLVVLAFPIMEMILESIVEEKMRKVGEKIRAHDVRMKEMLRRTREKAAAGADGGDGGQ